MLDDALDAVDAVVGVVGEAVDVVDVVDDFPFAKKKFSQELLSKEFFQMSLVLARPSKGEWFKQFFKFYCQKVCLNTIG